MPGVSVPSPDAGADFARFASERALPLRQFLLRMKVAEGDVQDVVQESLTRLLRYRDSEPATAWQALLYRIAINVARDRARHARVERELDGQYASSRSIEGTESYERSPEQHAIDQQQLSRMRDAVMRLPPRCREIYLLHRIEGMTYPEIARHVGISSKAVEKNIARALRLLREQLKGIHTRNHEDDA